MWQAWLLSQWGVALWLNLALVVLGLLSPQKALTRAGVIHAGLLGLLVWGGLGGRGYAVVAAYFLVGTAVTKLGIRRKQAQGIAEKREGARGPENVWGSALTGAVCALGYAFFPHPLWWLGYSASFAAKLADTVSSEVGKAYGRKTFLITTFQSVPAGTEGAVSLEGSLAGVTAAAGMAGLAWGIGGEWVGESPFWLGICWLAGILATLAESWMGVVLQPRLAWMTNEVVNGIQTTLAALLAVGLGSLMGIGS
ncbi:TIGR00297 family protein [Synechococcus sp. R60.3]|uniref:TIGR00297 family protein n=1 Tax=unclassified Synechococcus TaxID=2626047 RepID=UPI0039C49ADD